MTCSKRGGIIDAYRATDEIVSGIGGHALSRFDLAPVRGMLPCGGRRGRNPPYEPHGGASLHTWSLEEGDG